MSTSSLFTPGAIGGQTLEHRIVMAPLTRNRANDSHVHGDVGLQHYTQRASSPGGLIVTEATFIHAKASGQANVPGIWSEAQIASWKKIADAVHARGVKIFMQIWGLGRAAEPNELAKEARAAGVPEEEFPFVASGDIPMTTQPGAKPRPLTVDEIQEYIGWFVQAARNAIEGAGFDGVEVHGANGYLVDQFTSNAANNRTDKYGGAAENRARFALEIVDAVTAAVGEERTAIRFSPWSNYQEVRMSHDDTIETYSYLVDQLRIRHPRLAYLHLVEPVIHGVAEVTDMASTDSLDFARKLWAPRPLLLAGGYKPATGAARVEEGLAKGEDVYIVFGRYFISNPDLSERIKKGTALSKYDRSTFYTNLGALGYTDYPTADELSLSSALSSLTL